MNPKLLKERIKTKAQRPDIVVAYHNLLLRGEPEVAEANLKDAEEKGAEQRRTA